MSGADLHESEEVGAHGCVSWARVVIGAHGRAPLQADLPEGFQMTDLGPLPQEWRVVRLGELFEIQQGKALSPKARAGVRKRPFLRTANVLWGRVDLSVLDEMHFDEEEEARLALIPGDLLVCEGGDIGRTAIWEGQLPRFGPKKAGIDFAERGVACL
jgi:hypothetical protein